MQNDASVRRQSEGFRNYAADGLPSRVSTRSHPSPPCGKIPAIKGRKTFSRYRIPISYDEALALFDIHVRPQKLRILVINPSRRLSSWPYGRCGTSSFGIERPSCWAQNMTESHAPCVLIAARAVSCGSAEASLCDAKCHRERRKRCTACCDKEGRSL